MEKSFFDKRAADLMQRDVITIRPQDTLDEALSLMTENHVTGLPVMDHHSKCVGVVTANDILNCQRDIEEIDSETNVQFFDDDSQQWQSMPLMAMRTEKLKDTRVEEVMARELIRVDLHATVKSVAKTMLEAGVHRVLVLDEHNRLYGIVSALDFVRLVAQ